MIYQHFSADRYLNYFAEIEKCAFLMYEYFAKNESDTRLHIIWQNLAEEENQHAGQIENLRRLSRGKKCGNNRIDDQKIQRMASTAELYLDKVYHLPYDPYFACNLSVRLEYYFFELHAQRSMVFADEALQNLFLNLAEADTGHIRRLKNLYSAYFEKEIDLSSSTKKDSFLFDSPETNPSRERMVS